MPVAQAARLLNVHPRTVHRLVVRGTLTPIAKAPGMRGAYLLDPAAVAELAAERAKDADQ